MATDDTILISDSLAAREDGLAIGLKIPWYRSLWVSSVSDVVVRIDGAEVPKESLRAEINGKTFTIDELGDQWDELWFLQDRLVVVVPQDSPPSKGDEVDVEVTLSMRMPYMQIAPMVYVTNHATNHRTLVAG
ncbi:MAG: DUF6379 domain-containing protein [Actinobacteria bacterium]|nr:DUF6379 domain-containing protein [Actinomycetota bacterium]